MTPDEQALKLLSLALIDIRATARDWLTTEHLSEIERLSRIDSIADALHNLPGAIRAGIAAEELDRVASKGGVSDFRCNWSLASS